MFVFLNFQDTRSVRSNPLFLQKCIAFKYRIYSFILQLTYIYISTNVPPAIFMWPHFKISFQIGHMAGPIVLYQNSLTVLYMDAIRYCTSVINSKFNAVFYTYSLTVDQYTSPRSEVTPTSWICWWTSVRRPYRHALKMAARSCTSRPSSATPTPPWPSSKKVYPYTCPIR